jgi:hypothetical protein
MVASNNSSKTVQATISKFIETLPEAGNHPYRPYENCVLNLPPRSSSPQFG